MKIIFSPAKSMDFSNSSDLPTEINFPDKTKVLSGHLIKLSIDDISKLMKIKGKTLEHVMELYSTFKTSKTKEAIFSYNGTSFKQLELKTYRKDEFNFLSNHLIILSAFYGIVEPSNLIKEYRLDMNMKLLKDQTLYKFWKEEINNYFKDEDFILNLASKEFSKIIEKPMITIDFKEEKGKSYRSVSAYSKKGRGMILNYIVKNKITSIDQIKNFNLDGYSLNDQLSDKFNLIFTR